MSVGKFKFDFSEKWPFYLIIASSLVLMPALVKAQMFSVKSSSQTQYAIPHFHIYAGVGPAHFNYRPDDGRDNFAFDGQVAHLVLEAYNFKLFFEKGIGINNASYFETGIQGGYELSVYQSQNIRLQIPLQLQVGVTTVTTEGQMRIQRVPSFREGTISVRTGALFKARISPLFRFAASVIPHAGLTYSTGRYDGGGTVFGVTGNIRLFFDHLFGKAGLSVGYSYDFRQFNVKDNLYDYNAIENAFLIGITF